MSAKKAQEYNKLLYDRVLHVSWAYLMDGLAAGPLAFGVRLHPAFRIMLLSPLSFRKEVRCCFTHFT